MGKELLYKQITKKVYAFIQDMHLKPHDPVPSESELAKKFGVSRMTTKLALDLLAKEGIVYRMQRRGTFLAESLEHSNAHEMAHRLEALEKTRAEAEPPTRMIGMIVPELDDYTGSVVAAVQHEAKLKDSCVMIEVCESIHEEGQALRRLSKVQGVDGIVLFPKGSKVCGDELLRLKLDHYPVVVIDRIFKEVEIDCVYHDHYQGGYQLASYLIERGHREIGYLSVPLRGVTSREERYQGYVQALIDHKIPVQVSQVSLNSSHIDPSRSQSNQEEILRFIQRNPSMTAVVCGEDYVAAQLMFTCINHWIRIPTALSIVGFSDIRFSAILPVPLTTVKQSTEGLGKSAINLLFERIEHGRGAALTVKLNTEITERQSVSTINFKEDATQWT